MKILLVYKNYFSKMCLPFTMISDLTTDLTTLTMKYYVIIKYN